jgi:hypothetical protein
MSGVIGYNNPNMQVKLCALRIKLNGRMPVRPTSPVDVEIFCQNTYKCFENKSLQEIIAADSLLLKFLKSGQKGTIEDISGLQRTRSSNVLKTVKRRRVLPLIVCALLTGCGQAQKPLATSAVSPEVLGPKPATPVTTATPSSPTRSNAPIITPAKTVAAPSTPKVPSTAQDFEAKLHEISKLEEHAEFGRALDLCRALPETFDDHPEFAETIFDLSSRIAVEKSQADSIGFAATGLLDPGCAEIASQAFIDAGDAGKLLLRRAFRESGDNGDALKFTILQKLQTMGDEHLGELVAERLGKNPPEAVRRQLVEMLWSRIKQVDTVSLPALFAVAKANLEKNTDLTAYLLAAARRTGADRPAEYQQAFHDPAAYEFFKNQGLLNTVGSDGLAVCLAFDEKSGATVANSAPGGTTAQAKARFGPGKQDGAIKFNGADEMVTLQDPGFGIAQGGADFTLAFWFNLEQTATGNWRNITHKGNADDERTFALWMRPGDDAIHCRISTLGNSNDGIDGTATKIPLNTWVHVAYVKRGKTLKIYLNGAKDSEAALDGRVIANRGPIYIGKDPWYPGPACAIDEYRIYLRALTDSEVRLLAGLPSP